MSSHPLGIPAIPGREVCWSTSIAIGNERVTVLSLSLMSAYLFLQSTIHESMYIHIQYGVVNSLEFGVNQKIRIFIVETFLSYMCSS